MTTTRLRAAACAALAAGVAAYLWVPAVRGFFVLDDFYDLRVAQQRGLTLGLLRMPIFDHFAPGHHLLDWAVVELAPLRFGPALAFLVACYAGSVVLGLASLDLLVGRRFTNVFLVGWCGTTLLGLSAVQWWSAGAHTAPATLGTFAALYTYLRYTRGDGSRWLVASLAAFVVALLFFIKPILLPVYLVLLRFSVLHVRDGTSSRRAIGTIAKEWRIWLAYVAIVVAYLCNYFDGYWSRSPTPQVGQVAEYLKLAWLQSFYPVLLGAQAVHRVSAIGVLTIVVAQLALIGLVLVSVRRNGLRALWVWASWVVLFLLNALLTGLPRLVQFSPGIAFALRYFVEPGLIFPLFAGVALARRPPAPKASRGTGAVAFIAAVAFAAHVVAASRSASANERGWVGPGAKSYFARLTHDLAPAARRDLVDVSVPEGIVGSWLAPYNRASNVFAVLGRPLEFDDLGRPIYLPDTSGALRRASFVPSPGTLVSSAGIRLPRGRGCVPRGPRDAQLTFIPRSRRVGSPLYVRIVYEDAIAGAVSTYVDSGSGYGAPTDGVVMLGNGGDRAIPLGLMSVERVQIDLSGAVCVRTVSVGTFATR